MRLIYAIRRIPVDDGATSVGTFPEDCGKSILLGENSRNCTVEGGAVLVKVD
jgi:hypothetical protein